MGTMTIINGVLVLFLLMGTGYALMKNDFFNDDGVNSLTKTLCYVVSPCLIVYTFQIDFKISLLRQFLIAAAASTVINLLSIFLGFLLFNKKTVGDAGQRCMMKYSMVYTNCGFMGLPLLQTIAGTQGLLYGAAYIGVFNLFNWTHGIALYTGKTSKNSLRKVLLNPNVIALVIGISLFCFSIRLPGPIYDGIKFIAQLNTALSMIIVGTQISKVRLLSIFGSKLIWIGALLRNLIIPALLAFLLHIAGIHGIMLLCCILPVACPVASFTVIFAELVGKDSRFAVKLVTLSTIFCIATIPAIIAAISLSRW